MTYYEQIRQACIKNRPEILDLKMGCEVQFPDGKAIIEKRYDDMVGEVYKLIGVDCASFEKGCFGILGRPLHLEDILMVLGDKYCVDGKGVFYKWDDEEDEGSFPSICWYPDGNTHPTYDLSKPPQDQSPGTLKWICEQITNQ